MNNKPHEHSHHDLNLVLEWLRENFSLAFPRDKIDLKPLKLGIVDDILEFYDRLDTPPFSKKKLRSALAYYTLSPAYLKVQREGSIRVDLYGNEAETVTAEQASYAKQQFQKRYGKKNHQNSESKHANQ